LGAKLVEHKMKPWAWALLAALAPPAAEARNLGAAEAAIIGGASASMVLGQWCREHGLSALIARRGRAAAKTPDPAVLSALHVRKAADLRYRRVLLGCGDGILSRADNWYAPAQLTTAMNRRLATTDAPFGQVVSELGFHRSTLSIARRRAGPRVRAVLAKDDGTPFSYVIEDYVSAARQPAPTPSR
jgi:hypothetical protein